MTDKLNMSQVLLLDQSTLKVSPGSPPADGGGHPRATHLADPITLNRS